jgi:hypothetical protein
MSNVTLIDTFIEDFILDSSDDESGVKRVTETVASLQSKVNTLEKKITLMEETLVKLKHDQTITTDKMSLFEEAIRVLNAKHRVNVFTSPRNNTRWTEEEFEAFIQKPRSTPTPAVTPTAIRPSLQAADPPKITRARHGAFFAPSPQVPSFPVPPPHVYDASLGRSSPSAPKRLNFGEPRITEAQAVAHQLRIDIPPQQHITWPLGSPQRARHIRSVGVVGEEAFDDAVWKTK